jgi:hypothetical protein
LNNDVCATRVLTYARQRTCVHIWMPLPLADLLALVCSKIQSLTMRPAHSQALDVRLAANLSKLQLVRRGMAQRAAAWREEMLHVSAIPAPDSTCFARRWNRIYFPRPFGGEGGPQPAFSSAGTGRVRGSKTLGITNTIPKHRSFHSYLWVCSCGSDKWFPAW